VPPRHDAEPIPIAASRNAHAPHQQRHNTSYKRPEKETSHYYAQPHELTGFSPNGDVTPQNIYNHEAFRPRLWRGYKGASLHEVAKVWADEAGVDLIWNAPKGMPLKETISIRAPFANVIEQLLAQYNHKPFNLNGIMSMSETHSKPQLIVISR
jgi:hypothetical protein|tara:strand:- start:369 stop:830 length:462 start_codon:yes stop_codon:yes gene_type:complete